jgi:mannosyltransferase
MSSRTDTARDSWTWALVATIVLALLLRALGLDSQLWYDEIVTLVESVRLPIARIVSEFHGVNAHPLYSVVAHMTTTAFGEANWTLRLPAMLFGVASVGMVFVLATRVMSRPEAWAGALVLALSYHHIWFSQNARGYTMMGFFALFSLWCLIRHAETRQPKYLAWFVVASIAGVYTHLTMAFVVAGQAGAILIGRAIGWRAVRDFDLRAIVWSTLLAALGSMAVYAPLIPGLVEHMRSAAPAEAAKVATGWWAIAEALRQMLAGAGVPAAVATGAVAAIGAWRLWREAPAFLAILVAPALVTAVSLIVLSQPLRPRFFFFLAGAAAVCAGRGAGVIGGLFAKRELATAGVAVALATMSALALPRNYQIPKQDFVSAMAFLDGEAANGSSIAAAGPACFPVEHYFERPAWRCLESTEDLSSFLGATSPVLIVHTLGAYIEDAQLRERVLNACEPVRTFPGTLGGGDVVVCRPVRGVRP